ncbi:MAG: hypothetical protein HKO97_12065, partial [Flavobacteriaceae bacterium]|nr:hypothetical protein [Flavobacteriaceae bacterium]
MKKLLPIFILLFFSNLSAQVIWNNTYSKPDSDSGNAVFEKANGEYLVLGSSRSRFNTDYDINVLLIDANGDIVWDRYIGEIGR